MGSQTGRQTPGPIRRQPAIVVAGRSPIRPHPATCSDHTNAPEKRKGGGSTPPLTTLTSANAQRSSLLARFANGVLTEAL